MGTRRSEGVNAGEAPRWRCTLLRLLEVPGRLLVLEADELDQLDHRPVE
jgi:hypothetical protein